MRDHGLDAGVIVVGGARRRGQDVFVVEDVEPLVLHRAHIEGRYGDDHENVEVVFTAESGFVPAHGALETVHGVSAAILLARFDIDDELYLAARHGGEAIFDTGKIAADQRKQIGRFRERIVPHGKVPRSPRHVALRDEIAVGKQNRGFGLIGFDAGRVDRHHIRPVEEIGDAAEAFRLALRAIGRSGAIEAHQLRVAGRIDQRLDFERKRPVRHLRDGQTIRRRDVAACRQRLAVERQSDRSFKSSPSSTRGDGVAPALGLILSVARTVLAVGCRQTSSATVSMSQSGGR